MTESSQNATNRAAPLLHRHWLRAWWDARSAVKARMPLSEYLRYRAAQYLRALSTKGMRLPLEVSLEGGDLMLRELATGDLKLQQRPRTPEEAGQAWESELARRHGSEALAELASERAKTARLEEQIEQARADLAERREALSTALNTGKAGAAGDRASSAHLRPTVPSGVMAVVFVAAGAVFTLAETWQLALPMLNAAGVDVTDMGAELRRAPLGLFMGFAFAAICSGALVLLAHCALVCGRSALKDEATRREQLKNAALAGTSGGLALLFSCLLGALRHATSEAGFSLAAASSGTTTAGSTTLVFVLGTSIAPYVTAFLWDYSRSALVRRSELAQAARVFDLEVRAKEEERERLEERIQMAQQALFDLQVQRAGSEVAVRRLGWLGEEAHRETVEAEWLAGEALARAREELRAVLESDRFAYLKAAGRAGTRGGTEGRASVLIYAPEASRPGSVLAREAA
jgi:hypothetical protein